MDNDIALPDGAEIAVPLSDECVAETSGLVSAPTVSIDSCEWVNQGRNRANGHANGRKGSEAVNGRGEAALKPEAPERPWPASLGDAAYHGLAGEFVHAIEPHTEADPVSLLVQFLCMVGNCIGRQSYYPVGSARHCGNLDILLVGETSRSRNGRA